MVTRELAVAAQKSIESSGVGNWQMMEESKQFSGVKSPAVKRRLYVCCSTVIFRAYDSVRLL
jgi:hypothetical protein